MTTTGEVVLSDNDLLTDLTGFASLKTASALTITNNGSLVDLRPFGGVESVESLVITDNSSLPYCEVCKAFGQLISQGVSVTCNANLTDSCMANVQLFCP